MGKHPHWTKIELCFLLIPDEQVLLFKGPNPLQSTHWNPNPLSPLPLSTVCAVFFPYFSSLFLPFLDYGQRNKSTESWMSCGNLHEENHLRNQSFHHPYPWESAEVFDWACYFQIQRWICTPHSIYSNIVLCIKSVNEIGRDDYQY